MPRRLANSGFGLVTVALMVPSLATLLGPSEALVTDKTVCVGGILCGEVTAAIIGHQSDNGERGFRSG
jgi:hypothetical protein